MKKIIVHLTPSFSVKDRVAEIIKNGAGDTNDLAVVDALIDNPDIDVGFHRFDTEESEVVLSKSDVSDLRDMGFDVINRTP